MRKLKIIEDTIGEYRDKGSRFIAYAKAVESEEEIKAFLEELRKSHPNARHWCYAWRLGHHGEKYRTNDDGEPSGTAGRPILMSIDQKNLSNIVVIVVRYFGGTLLGVRGLIDAYQGAAKAALEHARTNIILVLKLKCWKLNYDRLSDLQATLNEFELKPTKLTYEQNDVRCEFLLDEEIMGMIEKRFSSIFGISPCESEDNKI